MTKTIVFIHGMFMTPLCWEHWVSRYQAQGYTCLAPAWPGRDKPIETLRKNHPDPELGRLNLTHIVEHLTGLIRQLNEKPVLIGHSMGGLVTQILLQRDLAAAGVAIDSAPPVGVFTTVPSFLKSNWPMINPLVSASQPRLMPFEDFQYAFVNGLPLAEQRGLRPLRRARVADDPPRIAGPDWQNRFQETAPAAPAHRRFNRPHHPRLAQQNQLREIQGFALRYRLQRIRRARALHHRAEELGRSS
jgi:pimeloyl-ACP methyl ester carboxylesterase